MIQRQTNPIQPQFGQANQPEIEEALVPLAGSITEVMFARRGRLYLLCEQLKDESLPASLYQIFYCSANYDPMRSLQRAFERICSADSSLQVVAGALVHNMTLYTVGTINTCVWLWRSRRLIQVLPNPKGSAINIPEKASSSAINKPTCHDAQRRLYPGDVIILSSSAAARRIGGNLLRQAEAFGAAPESLARAISQLTRSKVEPHPPITVIRLPGTPTTPNLTPQSQMDLAYADVADVTPRAKVPPILIAVVIATIAIILALIVTKPQLPPNLLRNFLIRTPLATLAIRTASPGGASPTLTPSVTPQAAATAAD